MKFIPDSLGRKIGEQSLFASEKAPKVLFVGGVIGMVGSTVLACRATLKLEEVLDNIDHNKAAAEDAKQRVDTGQVSADVTYSDKEYKKDLYIINTRGLGSVVKLYAPSVLLGAASIAALTKSHNLLKDRNLALTAAYAAIDAAYTNYRARVVERYGEEVDRELMYEVEQVEIVDEETGEVLSTTHVTAAPGSPYARWFDSESSANWSQDPTVRLYFLRTVQTYANDRLKARGHVFLNEVYDDLGLSHTRAGAIVGWRWGKDSGDDRIDFGIWNKTQEDLDELFDNGREGAVLLDFNVDGPIAELIEETVR